MKNELLNISKIYEGEKYDILDSFTIDKFSIVLLFSPNKENPYSVRMSGYNNDQNWINDFVIAEYKNRPTYTDIINDYKSLKEQENQVSFNSLNIILQDLLTEHKKISYLLEQVIKNNINFSPDPGTEGNIKEEITKEEITPPLQDSEVPISPNSEKSESDDEYLEDSCIECLLSVAEMNNIDLTIDGNAAVIYQDEPDIKVAVEYQDDTPKEAELEKLLNDMSNLKIGDKKIIIKPIHKSESGTLSTFISKDYSSSANITETENDDRTGVYVNDSGNKIKIELSPIKDTYKVTLNYESDGVTKTLPMKQHKMEAVVAEGYIKIEDL